MEIAPAAPLTAAPSTAAVVSRRVDVEAGTRGRRGVRQSRYSRILKEGEGGVTKRCHISPGSTKFWPWTVEVPGAPPRHPGGPETPCRIPRGRAEPGS